MSAGKSMRKGTVSGKARRQLRSNLLRKYHGGTMSYLFQKLKTQKKIFYLRKTIEHNWSRSVLKHHIESGELDEKVVSSILEHTIQHGAIKGKLAKQQLFSVFWPIERKIFRTPKDINGLRG